MKTLIAAIALTIAIPAAANAQSAQQQGSHDQHRGMAMKCCDKAAKEGKRWGAAAKVTRRVTSSNPAIK